MVCTGRHVPVHGLVCVDVASSNQQNRVRNDVARLKNRQEMSFDEDCPVTNTCID